MMVERKPCEPPDTLSDRYFFGREEAGQIFVGASGQDLALVLQVGLYHTELTHANRVIETDEAKLTVLKEHKSLRQA